LWNHLTESEKKKTAVYVCELHDDDLMTGYDPDDYSWWEIAERYSAKGGFDTTKQ